VHGSGGNLASLPLRVIARALSARGYAALSISTRQHDEHVNTDNFFDVRQDIEAAVVTAKALGFRSIILQGHSLGTVQAAFYAASDWDPTIKAVVEGRHRLPIKMRWLGGVETPVTPRARRLPKLCTSPRPGSGCAVTSTVIFRTRRSGRGHLSRGEDARRRQWCGR